MIQANELRIGNILKSAHTGEYIEADWLVIKHVMDGNRQSPPYDMSSVYEPIPLTEELLLKCGFKKEQFNDRIRGGVFDVYSIGLFLIAYRGDSEFVPVRKHDNITLTVDGVAIKHLHQLQNLYFALTGEELGVKL